MTFKRLLMPMVVLGIIFMMGTMAYAQTNINCGLSVPLGSRPRAANTGHTEPIAVGLVAGAQVSPTNGPGGGALRVTCINGGTLGTATDPGVVVLSINLGVPITNTTTNGTTPTGHPNIATDIRIGTAAPNAPSGDFTNANVSINTTSYAAGTIVIGLGTCAAACTNGSTPTTGINFTAGGTSTFDLLGVLVSTNGKTGAISAILSSAGGVNVGPAATGAGTAAGPATIPVIDAVLPALKDPTVPSSLPALAFFTGPPASAAVSGGAAVLNSSGGAIKGNFVLRIEENYPDLFREAAQFNGGPALTGVFPNSPSSDTEVQIVLNNIPSGLDISGCSATVTNLGGTAVTGGTPSVNFTNITAAAPILTINFNSAVDLDNVDVLWVKCTTVGLGTAAVPLPSTPVTAQVTMAPTGAALSSTSGALTGLTTGQVPRYQSLLQPATALTVVVFPPSNTTLLLSFAAVGPGYNTGIAIANTTLDPFTPAGGGAAASAGTVSFLMAKNDGTSKVYTTTTGSPGAGLTGAGVVASGSTYAVNLSEILAAANYGTSFTGYVFITANFTDAHGAATIYTTSNGAAALSSPVLVLPGISTATVRATPEGLDQ